MQRGNPKYSRKQSRRQSSMNRVNAINNAKSHSVVKIPTTLVLLGLSILSQSKPPTKISIKSVIPFSCSLCPGKNATVDLDLILNYFVTGIFYVMAYYWTKLHVYFC